MASDLPLVIYVVRAGDSYKIGRTRDLKGRLKTIRCHSADPIEIIATGFGPPSLEVELHRRFAPKRLEGEWFELDDEDVAYLRERLDAPHIGKAATQKRPMGHVRQLTGNRWRLYAAAAPDPVTGLRRQATKVVTAASRRDALDLLAEHVTAVKAGRWDSATRARTVDQALDAWLEQVEAEPNTVHEWKGALARYIRPELGVLRLDQLETQTIDRLYRQLLRTGGANGTGVSASTIRKAHTPLRLALGQAVRWKWIPANPAADATAPVVRKTAPTPPDVAAVTKLIVLADLLDKDWACALRVLAHTGIRRGELCGLRWSDIDLEAGELAVRRVVKRVGNGIEIVEHPKNASSSRRIALGAGAVVALTALRARSRERALGAGVRSRDGFVFTNDPAGRTPWHPVVLTHRFARLRKRAGHPEVRLHDLRHHMATRWLSEGVDVVTVAGRGGWANASTLLSVYAHWVPARDRDAARRLDDVG